MNMLAAEEFRPGQNTTGQILCESPRQALERDIRALNEQAVAQENLLRGTLCALGRALVAHDQMTAMPATDRYMWRTGNIDAGLAARAERIFIAVEDMERGNDAVQRVAEAARQDRAELDRIKAAAKKSGKA